MKEFKGKKWKVPYLQHSKEYIEWLENRVEELEEKIRQKNKSILKLKSNQNTRSKRDYYEQADYLPYEEDDRECGLGD
jgi:hypothetical protein